jgi:hypothetical protein
MRVLIIIISILFLGMSSSSQMIIKKRAMSEYLNADLYSDSNVYTYIFSGNVAFRKYNIGSRKAVDVSPLFNQMMILDDQGYLWKNNPGSATCVRVDVDTFGNAFNYNGKTFGYFFSFITISKDSGTLTYGNGDTYNFYGQGGGGTVIYKPRPLHAPSGKKWIDICMGNNILGLTSAGEVYLWPNGDTNYRQLTIPGVCVGIAASHNDFFLFNIHDYSGGNASLGNLYWLGSQWDYVGDNNSRTQPYPLASIFKTVGGFALPYHVKQVVCDDNSIHFIDSVNDVYGTGDNPIGNVGNGTEIVNKYTYSSPYSWSMNRGEAYTHGVCYKIFSGAKKLQFGTTYTFNNALIDMNDSLWVWGRNKSFSLPLGIANNNEVTWPDAIDVLAPKQASGFQYFFGTYYNFSLSTLTAVSTPTVNTPSGTLSVTGAAATFGSYGYNFVGYQWTQISGPNTATITNASSSTTTVTGLIPGTYVFRVVGTDNNTGTASSTASITYTPGSQCNCTGNTRYRGYKKG